MWAYSNDMRRVLIKDLHDYLEKEVTISGWVDVARNQGKMAFFDFRDRSGKIQGVVFDKPDVLEIAKALRSEWVVCVQGKVHKRPENMVKKDAPNGDIELEVTSIEVLGQAQELPFDLDAELNIDTHLDNLPLTLRTDKGRDIFTLQATLIESFRKALRDDDFIEFQNPALVGGDAEGGAGAFEVPYFNDKKVFLATSPQLYKQIMVGIFERVFTTPRVFRAEKHATTRHLSEYITLDFEMGFITDHTDVMSTLEEIIRKIIDDVTEHHTELLARFGSEIPKIPEKIPVMKLREAQEIIKKKTGKDCTKEPDLEPVHERFLCEYALKEFGSDLIFITHYPVTKRPFYTYEDEDDPGYTKSFDLLFRGVEITTGGQRIHQYKKLIENLKKWKLDPEKFSFYLQAFKYGMPPHGGSATGLERFTAKMLNIANIKEATLFPRDINRIDLSLSKNENHNDE